MIECSLSGRGQGHVSNFYIVDLENFATASRRYTGDIHNSVRMTQSAKPEVHDVSLSGQKRTEPRSQVTGAKISETHRHGHHNTPLSYREGGLITVRRRQHGSRFIMLVLHYVTLSAVRIRRH